MYDLVADVDSYRQFVPYCVGSQVLKSEVQKDTNQEYPIIIKEAELRVGFLSFNEAYVSKVTCTPYISVEVSYSQMSICFPHNK